MYVQLGNYLLIDTTRITYIERCEAWTNSEGETEEEYCMIGMRNEAPLEVSVPEGKALAALLNPAVLTDEID